MNGLRAKLVFPGAEGLWIEFHTQADAQSCYAQILNKGGRAEIKKCTVIMKHPSKETPQRLVNCWRCD